MPLTLAMEDDRAAMPSGFPSDATKGTSANSATAIASTTTRRAIVWNVVQRDGLGLALHLGAAVR